MSVNDVALVMTSATARGVAPKQKHVGLFTKEFWMGIEIPHTEGFKCEGSQEAWKATV